MLDKAELLLLISKHQRGETVDAEEQILIDFCESFQNEDAWNEHAEGAKAAFATEIYALIEPVLRRRNTRTIPLINMAWMRYAAVLLIIAGAGVFFYASRQKPLPVIAVNTTTAPEDLLPGRSGAILTLADGSNVLLDSLNDGPLLQQQGAQIVLNKGQLMYGPADQNITGTPYNTISTPNGRQFQVVLPDGTKAWLNAASSLTYPVAFTGDTRKVKVTGEVYFEIARQVNRPFTVNINERSTIDVLGTSFNVNAYNDEPAIATTLVEGSVRLKAGDYVTLLAPGEQGFISPSKPIKVITGADVEQAVGWKKGVFNFNKVPLQQALRQLSKWYDFEVRYEGNIPPILFGGEMGRDLNLSQVLKLLENSKVHFRIEEGRRLVVTP